MKETAVEWFAQKLSEQGIDYPLQEFQQAKEMEKELILDFGEFIIDELAPMAQNREWVEERYNYFKSE